MMRNFRLGLLLVSVAVLVIFIQQNLSLVLPLTFLGTKTIALPLCLWILLALAAGGLTSGLIFMLLLPSSVQRSSSVRDRSQKSKTDRSRDLRNDRYSTDKYRDPDPEPARATADATSSGDWEDDEENWVDADPGKQGDRYWEEDEENWVAQPIDPAPTEATTQEVYATKTDYEVPQEPVSNYQAGSIYSYSYRSSENTGVGTTESVNDAEYRVIVPPSGQSEEDSGESPADDYPSNDYNSDEYSSDEYPSEYESSEPQTGSSTSQTAAEPTPEPTPVYKTDDRAVQTNPTKIQTNPTKIQTDDEDDWSKPSNHNNDDWV